MTALLPAENYPQVRAALDITLSAADLPDVTIALDIFAGAAVRDVLALDSDAESRTGTELAHAQAAAIYFAASRLALVLPQVTQERDQSGNQVRRQVTPPEVLAAELRSMASFELEAYLATTGTMADMPTMFTVARGYRGRW